MAKIIIIICAEAPFLPRQIHLTNNWFFVLRCVDKFCCSSCDKRMTVKTKFYEVDLKPVCKKCYEK